MRLICPHCKSKPKNKSGRRIIIHVGKYRRKSDCREIQRYKCKACKRGFSSATLNACYLQNKRHKNAWVLKLLASGVSQRRTALLVGINRKTVARKLQHLGDTSRASLEKINDASAPIEIIEFDDMETFEHTKCKPVSITLAVEYKTRRYVAFETSKMPANGKLAAISRKRYGRRADGRPAARKRLFKELKKRLVPDAVIKSDLNPHYVKDVKAHFPHAKHARFRGRRGCIVGQGELKAGGRDPLFTLNHTAAMTRENVSSLKRRTWSTTKKIERLADHIAIYAHYHNTILIKKKSERKRLQT